MARSFTVAQLMQRVRDEADMHGGFIADAELIRYISSAYAELYDLLVSSGLAYFEETATFTTGSTVTAGVASLPANFLGALGVDYQVQASPALWEPLRALQPIQRNLYQSDTSQRAEAFRIAGSSLILQPAPPDNGQVYRLVYVPTPADLTTDAATVDGISGWEEYVVIEVAIKCLAKEETDVSTWLARKEAIKRRIEEQREVRALGLPRAVVDVYEQMDWPGDFLRRWERDIL